MRTAASQVIWLRHDAPTKPAPGAPCNGCGVCCAAEPCPVAMLRFWRRRGPCPALQWSETGARYHCGLLANPAGFFPWLPRRSHAFAQRLLRRWIAAGIGCDSDAELRIDQP